MVDTKVDIKLYINFGKCVNNLDQLISKLIFVYFSPVILHSKIQLTDIILSTVDMTMSKGHMHVRPSAERTHLAVLWHGFVLQGFSTGIKN